MRKVALVLSVLLVSACFGGILAKSPKASHKQAIVDAPATEAIIPGLFEELDATQFAPADGVREVSTSLLAQSQVSSEDLHLWGRQTQAWKHQSGGEIFVLTAKDRVAHSFDLIMKKLREASLCQAPSQNQLNAFVEIEQRLREKCAGTESAAFLYHFSDNYELKEGSRFAASHRLALVVCHADFTQVAITKYQTILVTLRRAEIDEEAFKLFIRSYFRFAFFNSFSEICLKTAP